MGGWRLSDVEDLDGDTYRALIEWITDATADPSGESSIDMDAFVSAKRAGDERKSGRQ